MDRETGLIDLEDWLTKAGLPEAVLESQGDLLVVKLPPDSRNHLLADPELRQDLVRQAKDLCFQRIALDLP